jgi:hypothetical protein
VWLSFGLRACRAPWGWCASRGVCPALSSNARLAVLLSECETKAVRDEGAHRVDPHKLSATIEVADKNETARARLFAPSWAARPTPMTRTRWRW